MPEEFQGQRQVRRQDGALSQLQAHPPGADQGRKRSRSTPPRRLPAAAQSVRANSSSSRSPGSTPSSTRDGRPIVAAVTVVVLRGRVAGRRVGRCLATCPIRATAVGLLLVSPPLVVPPTRSSATTSSSRTAACRCYIRSALCSLGLRGSLGRVRAAGLTTCVTAARCGTGFCRAAVGGRSAALVAWPHSIWNMASGVFHYGFYLLVTVLLRWAAGMGWIWECTELSCLHILDIPEVAALDARRGAGPHSAGGRRAADAAACGS